MSVVRVVFLGTPEFARYQLESLLKDEHYEVVGVVTQPDRPSGRNMKLKPSEVKAFAIDKGLEVLSPENINTEEVLAKVAGWNAEAAIVVAFGQIVSQQFLDLFQNRVVNIHGSLLPKWRGAAPIQRAIQQGDEETGVALQVMVKKLDAGAVLGVRKIKIVESMDAMELHDELKILGTELLEVEFMDYLRGNLVPEPQDESQVTYASKIDKSESKIDWSKTAAEISGQVRGFQMGPGSFALLAGKKMKIHRVLISDGKGKPGKILGAEDDHFEVACGSGSLKVYQVQPESKPRMSSEDYLRGYELPAKFD